jgi:hypothetical protein
VYTGAYGYMATVGGAALFRAPARSSHALHSDVSVERVDNPPWAGSLHSELLSKLVKHLERLCANVRVRAVRRNPQLTGSSNWITFTP